MEASSSLISDIVLNSWDILGVSKEIGSALAETPNADMKWDEFAMKLMGTNNTRIKQIKQSKSDYGDRCKALLEYWKATTEEPRWDSIVAMLREVDLDGPAGILNRAITRLKQRNSRKRPLGEVGPAVGSAHQPIPEASNKSEDETDHGPLQRKFKHHSNIDGQELKQKYKDKFPDGAITRKKQWDDLKEQQLEILIQTVNEREFYAVMIKLEDVSMYTVKTTGYSESYYYVGKWGDKAIPVVIVQTTMGSDGPNGSYNETRKALSCLPNIKYIFSVGVCGGVKGKVKLGDVIVSKILQDCSNEKVLDDKVIIRSPSWSLVGNSFYHFLSQAANKPDIMRCGMVLSANKLVADANVQGKLLVQFPEAIAFEMEGHGIARACEEYKSRETEFLVVKGVSDLADKDKNDDWQPQAAVNAADALYEVMAKYDAFDYEEDHGSSTSVVDEAEHDTSASKKPTEDIYTNAKAKVLSNYESLMRIRADAILPGLFAKGVITSEDKQIIDAKTLNREKMRYLIDNIIIQSLDIGIITTYKEFLNVLERNDDRIINTIAQRLGHSKDLP